MVQVKSQVNWKIGLKIKQEQHMGKLYEEITPEIAGWIQEQHLFFVSTAPLSGDGHINCSPKGLNAFRVLGPRTVAYLDLTGSGAETIAHLRENGRIVFMFCAMSGLPKIVRLHGTAEVVTAASSQWPELRNQFPAYHGARSIICAEITRISDSCGFGVPQFEYLSDRETLPRWAETRGEEGLKFYRQEKNRLSIDGLPAVESD
jgi:hypothetical protein